MYDEREHNDDTQDLNNDNINNPVDNQNNQNNSTNNGEYHYTRDNNPGENSYNAGNNYNSYDSNPNGSYNAGNNNSYDSNVNGGYNAGNNNGYDSNPSGSYNAGNNNSYNNSYNNNANGGYNSGNSYSSNYRPRYNANSGFNNNSSDSNKNKKNFKKSETKEKRTKEHKGVGVGVLVAIALVCAMVGGFVGAACTHLVSSSHSSGTANIAISDRTGDTSAAVETQTVVAGEAMTPSQIYSTYGNAVVSVNVSTSSGEGAGTGFIIDGQKGYVMTCYHVIDGAQQISVVLIDSTSYAATYVGGDEDQDVAILQITPNDGETLNLSSVVLGDSSLLAVGDDVCAIGNALGELANTLTSGTVSALDRAISMSDGTVMNLMQTDTTINSGNSGGPLFNQYGEVIGIVNAKYSSSAFDSSTASIEGIGFAIPINDVTAIMDDLIANGYITGKPYLGISVATVSAVAAQQYKDMVVGAYVSSVTSGSCAETAGLQQGDIITQADGKDITTSAELIDAKNAHKAGDEMTLTVYRDSEYITLKVTLDEEKPTESPVSDGTENNDSNNSQGSSDYGYSYGYNFGNGNSSNPFSFFGN